MEEDPVRRARALPPFFALLGVAVWLPPGAYPWCARRKVRALPCMLRVPLAVYAGAIVLGVGVVTSVGSRSLLPIGA